MIRKIAIMAGMAATLASAGVAHAGYYETFNNFRGDFSINNFEDGDKKFTISLSNLDGTVGLKIPAPGSYGATLTPGSSFGIDYNGAQGFDFGGIAPAAGIPLGSGKINSINFGLPFPVSSMDFNFNGVGVSTFLLNGSLPVPTGTTRHVDVSGSGATNFFAALFGIPGFLAGDVLGTLGVDITFDKNDALTFVLDSNNLTGTNLEAVMKGFDDARGSLNDGQIDGKFFVNGSVHVPEPGSLALLGLGLAGLATARRRAANKTA